MNSDKILSLYDKLKAKHGNQAHKHVSNLLRDIKDQYKKSRQGYVSDYDQAWRSFKGQNLENLIFYIIEDQVRECNLELVRDKALKNPTDKTLSLVKRKLLVDYGQYGAHLPDADIVIYDPKNSNILAILSIKVTLRERIAQTGYWKLKLQADEITQSIRMYFITLDEDQVFSPKRSPNKPRAITEIDTDGCYVMTEHVFETSEKIKPFEQFIEDLQAIRSHSTSN